MARRIGDLGGLEEARDKNMSRYYMPETLDIMINQCDMSSDTRCWLFSTNKQEK